MSNSLHTYPCLLDRTNGRSPVREKHLYTYPCLLDRTNGRSPVREKYTYTPILAYWTAQMADRRSGKNTHTHLSLPTGPHKWQIAGQGKIHIHTYPCLLDRTNGRSPVREKYTHTYPCLLDRTNGRSPVREKYTYTPIPAWQIAGQGKTLVHHVPAYQIAQMADCRSGRNTHICDNVLRCCRHALYTYTCTLYLRAPRTVGSHFSLCRSRGRGTLDMILSSLLCEQCPSPRCLGTSRNNYTPSAFPTHLMHALRVNTSASLSPRIR